MLSKEDIERGKREVNYSLDPHYHEHNTGISIAYQWLDARPKLIRKTSKALSIKHIIEIWSGSYISQSDVEVAAYLHPEIFGDYPYYNIHGDFAEPIPCRLVGLLENRTKTPQRQFNKGVFFEKVKSPMRRVPVKESTY